jgi:hypothetical protein
LNPSTRTSTADAVGFAQAAASLPRIAARDGAAFKTANAMRTERIFNEITSNAGNDEARLYARAPVHFPLQCYLGAVCGQIMVKVRRNVHNRGQGMANI